MLIIGLILARSGSKGLVNKNIIDFEGKPLMAHSIKSSNDSLLINRTIVSTDSEKYADIAIKYNAEVPFIRPKEISGDFTQDSEVFIHLIKELDLKKEDIVVQIRPTNPRRSDGLIDKVVSKMIKDKLPAIRTISPALFSPYKMVQIDKNYIKPVIDIEGKKYGTDMPRQLLPQAYELNGNVDAFFVNTFFEHNSFFPSNTGFFLQEEHTIDIDYKSDLIKLTEQKKFKK